MADTAQRIQPNESAALYHHIRADGFWPISDESGANGTPTLFVNGVRYDGAVCPVREACLEYALTTREKDGVWGGYTARERRRIIRRRRKTA